MPLVSIVIPVYNVERYVERCLLSIQQQTLTDIELIVVNDCTPDNAMGIVQRMSQDDQRIRIINCEENVGPMIAREKGYMAASGEYITFCDGDDYLPLTAMENFYSAATESGADIVCGNHLYITTKGEELRCHNALRYGNSSENILKSLLRQEISQTLWGKLFRASLLQNHVYHTYKHATNGEDGCLLYQVVANINRLSLINDTVYCYVQNTASSSQKRRSYAALESLCITNAEIVRVVNGYPELRRDLAANMSSTLISLIYRGYNQDGTLTRLFAKYELDTYCSLKTIIRSHGVREALKLLLKKYLFRKQVAKILA